MNRIIPALFVGYHLSEPVIDCERPNLIIKKNNLSSLSRAKLKSKQYVVQKMHEVGAPGMVVAVSVDGLTLWSQAFGAADIENSIPCSVDTVMRVASISKSFTATAMARLWESGKLDLDKPIKKYLPSYPETYHDGKKVEITLRQLLSHSAGIRHYKKASNNGSTTSNKTSDNDKKSEEKDNEFKAEEYLLTTPCKTVTEALKMFQDDQLINKPGKEFLYSTHAFTLISAVLEEVSQQDFLTLMLDTFRRLGMYQTVPDFHDKLVYGRARYYQRNKNGRLINAPYVDISYKWAGGGFLSTVSDLIKFGNAMMYSYQQSESSSDSAKSNNPPGILKPQTVKMLWSPVVKPKREKKSQAYENTSYGLGWFVYPEMEELGCCADSQLEVVHTGGAIGASSVLFLMPNTKPHDHRVYVRSQSCSFGDVVQDVDEESSKEDISMSPTSTEKPVRGISVAIITNIQGVSLTDLARSIAREFDQKLQSSL